MNVYNSSVTHSQPTLSSHGASVSPLHNHTRTPPEHVSLEWTLSLGVIVSLVVFVIVLGNSLIIASVARFRRLHTQPNYFIASLACADLLMGLIVVPFGATPIVSGTWYFGETFCGFWTALDIMCVTASIDTLCAIAVDRYIAVTRPLRYETLMNKRRARIIIVSVWVVSALISFLPMQMGWLKEPSYKTAVHQQEHAASNGSGNNTMTCEFDITPGYAIVSSAVSFYLPMFVMIFVYSKVFREAQKQRKKIDRCEVRSNHHQHHHQHEHNDHERQHRMDNGTGQPSHTSPGERRKPTGTSGGKKLSQILSRKDHKALKTMGLIMGTFTLCWLPFFVVNIVRVYCSCMPRDLFVILNWLGYANSAFNPIIYCRSPELRMAMKRLLCFWRSGSSSGSGSRVTRRPLSCGTSDGGLASSPGWTSFKRSSQPELSSTRGFLMDEGGGGSCVIATPRAVSCEGPGTTKVPGETTITTNNTTTTNAATAVASSGGGGGEEEPPRRDNGVLDSNGNAHSCQ